MSESYDNFIADLEELAEKLSSEEKKFTYRGMFLDAPTDNGDYRVLKIHDLTPREHKETIIAIFTKHHPEFINVSISNRDTQKTD